MHKNISTALLEKWLTGWSLSRSLPLPVPFASGFKTDVGYEKQKARYVFPKLNEDLMNLANAITEPWVFLKACAPPDALEAVLPPRWVIQPQGYMMVCSRQSVAKPVSLPPGYVIEREEYNAVYVIKIMADNDVAAIGRVVLVEDAAIYDRIATAATHQRKGLAALVMTELEKIARSKGISKNILVATDQGKRLYESLGWELLCLYTSAVIPGQ